MSSTSTSADTTPATTTSTSSSSSSGNAAGVGTGAGAGGNESSLVLLNQPIVIDNGTSSIKAGFAGSSKPKTIIGTKVGRTKHLRIMPGGALEVDPQERGSASSSSSSSTAAASGSGVGGASSSSLSSVFVGRRLDEHRGAFVVEYPMDMGIVVDHGWDSMERLWEHVYSKQCLNAKQEEHPILLTEAPLNPRRNREKMAEIMFESIRVPALYFAPPSVLSLYASGRMTGVVLDVGEGVTHTVPVYEGFALHHSVTRSNIAGRDVTNQFQLLLRRAGLHLSTTAEYDLVKTMKEQLCYLVPTDQPSDDMMEKESRAQYQLPDGQSITLSSERYMAPNVLFDPTLIGSEEPSISTVLVNSIMKSDVDLRSKLFGQIVLAGGTTMMNGFGDRLLYDIRSKSPSHTRIRISAPPERYYSAYVGGSILASLATFKNMWTSRAEYEEYGTNLLHRSQL